MKKQTVHQLRKNGWKVKVGHLRSIFKYDTKTGIKHIKICLEKDRKTDYPDFFLSAKGGVTVVSVTSPQGQTYCSQAICNVADYYNNKIGLEIALGRVLSKFENVP